MVHYSTPALDRTFAALADPTRRAIVAMLGEKDEAPVSEIAAPFAMSLPAVLKHIGVLTEAGIVSREKRGRTVRCKLNAEPLRDAGDWLKRYEKFWTERLDALATLVESPSWPNLPDPPPPRGRTSSSNAASKPRAKKSTRR